MRLMPASYNGFLFQQINRVASDFQTPYDWTIQGITTSDIQRSQNFPLRVAKNYTGAIKVINVNLLDVDITRDDLVMAMDVLGAEQIQLIATDEFGRSWYVNADFIGLTEDTQSSKTASFGAVFAVDDPIWKKLIPSTETIVVNAGSSSGFITPIGNQSALPIITITPLGQGDNPVTYQRFVTIINNSPNPLVNYPIDITDGGMDTATIIAGGGMLANGDDLRIYIDGVEVKRWFGGGGIDSATTTIWINFNQPAKSIMTLGADIAASGAITEIQFQNTANNLSFINVIPIAGNVLIDSEIFVYTGVDTTNLKLTGVTRGERQTTEGAHTEFTQMYFVTHDVWLYYGDLSSPPYVVDDTYKPIINLTSSTNTSHVYDEFYTLDGKRTAQWLKGTYLPALNSHHYTATENTSADPASVAGLWNSGASVLYWTLYNPCGFIEVTSLTGKKYSANGAFNAEMLWSRDDINYNSFFTESDPTAGAGWVALDTHTNQAVPSTPAVYYLRLYNYGFTGPAGVNENGMEMESATFEIDSNFVPTITIAPQADDFQLNTTIYNYATDYTLQISVSLRLNFYLIVNTKEKTVTLYDGSNQINAIQDFPIRAEWFPLLPQQENEIEVSDTGNVQYVFEWEDRAL